MTERERQIFEYGMLEGKVQMAWNLAVWKDGKPVCSVMEHPYKQFVSKFEHEQRRLRRKLNLSHCELLGCSGCAICKPSSDERSEQ